MDQLQATKSQEFCLTEPKPQPLPMPEIIPEQKKCKPVPITTHRTPKELKVIQQIKQKNNQKTKELLNEANMKQFRCRNPQMSEHNKRAMDQIQKDFDSKLQFSSFHPTKIPQSNKNINIPVKPNKAAKMRETALLQRKKKEELQRKEMEKEASKDIKQKDAEHKRVLALQKKSKKEQEELRRLNQIKSSNAKTAEHGLCKMGSNYGSLVKEAIVLLDKFSEGKQTLDQFIEDATKDLQDMDAQHKKFILDVVSGSTEHRKLLDEVVEEFYNQNGETLSSRDRHQFVIICYLAIFMIEDIGLQSFSNIVKSLNIEKMHTFLYFLFTRLTTTAKEERNDIYDAACVDEQWIGPLLRWRPDVVFLADQLALKMSCESQVKKAPIKTTKPQELCLTEPKPQPPTMAKLIPEQKKCKPVPITTHRSPKELKVIQQIKQKNNQKTKELLNEANMKQFRCGNPQMSEHTKRAMDQIQKDFDSKLQFSSLPPTKPLPSNKNINIPVKPNKAAKMRETALLQRKKKEELQRKEMEKEASKDIKQKDAEHKRVLALQKKSKKEQEELRRLNQIKSSNAKTAKHGLCKMGSNYGSLVKEAIVLLDKFSEGKQTLDQFIEDAAKDLQAMDAQHKRFILDVVSGSIMRRKLLDIVVINFYSKNGGTLSSRDWHQFVIICYLAIFLIEDIGLQCFRDIVKSLDIKEIYTFLNFLFTRLTRSAKEERNDIYDAACVEEQWIGPLLRLFPNVEFLADPLTLKMSCESQVKKAPIKTTKPQELCLTEPKPQPPPMAKLIPEQKKCKPVPITTYRTPKQQQIRQKNLRRAYLPK
ncbi:putative leucine-rich repeat-containing protein DDB_G0290503 [Paralichthys olivaceus]|uniref:putative leucine-rich repeat-containing protein DDB_G0290503 n=1 Tax=Paralichthys olivaceus TaxID=8255 RepID=UPI003751464E